MKIFHFLTCAGFVLSHPYGMKPIMISPETHRRAKELSARLGVKLGDLANKLLSDAIGKIEGPDAAKKFSRIKR